MVLVLLVVVVVVVVVIVEGAGDAPVSQSPHHTDVKRQCGMLGLGLNPKP